MYIITPSEDIEDLLAQFRKAGGVVEYDFAEPESEEAVDAAAHRQVILLTSARWNEDFKAQRKAALRYIQTNKEYRRNYPPDLIAANERQYAQDIAMGLRNEPDRLCGEAITPLRFLGQKLIDISGKREIRRQTLSMQAELEQLGAPAEAEADDTYDPFANGYAYAFSDPPYGLSGSYDAKLKLFRAINRAVFHNFMAGIQIYQWSTDWCSYFDPGEEWWGSFLWTVYHPTCNFIVVVAASTTD